MRFSARTWRSVSDIREDKPRGAFDAKISALRLRCTHFPAGKPPRCRRARWGERKATSSAVGLRQDSAMACRNRCASLWCGLVNVVEPDAIGNLAGEGGQPRRSRRGRTFVAVLLPSLAGASAAGLAWAEGVGERIHLDYHSSEGCPDETSFVARIRGRTTAVRFVERGEAARTFAVTLESGSPASGSVAVTEGERGEGARRLEADSCEHLADALALIVALALDPHALAAPVATPPAADSGAIFDSGAVSSSKVDLEASTPTPPMDLADAGPPVSFGPPGADAPPPSISMEEAPPSPQRVPSAYQFFVGGDFVLATGVAPAPLYTGSPYVGWRYTRLSQVGPTVRGSFLHAESNGASVLGGAALNFSWTLGRIDGCATVWPRGRVKLNPCARFEAGALDVTGSTFSSSGVRPLTPNGPWLALGGLGRVEVTLFGPLSFDAEVGAIFPLSAGNFVINPARTTAYKVPYRGLEAGTGLGLSFP
jgi:hypothetical protein